MFNCLIVLYYDLPGLSRRNSKLFRTENSGFFRMENSSFSRMEQCGSPVLFHFVRKDRGGGKSGFFTSFRMTGKEERTDSSALSARFAPGPRWGPADRAGELRSEAQAMPFGGLRSAQNDGAGRGGAQLVAAIRNSHAAGTDSSTSLRSAQNDRAGGRGGALCVYNRAERFRAVEKAGTAAPAQAEAAVRQSGL